MEITREAKILKEVKENREAINKLTSLINVLITKIERNKNAPT